MNHTNFLRQNKFVTTIHKSECFFLNVYQSATGWHLKVLVIKIIDQFAFKMLTSKYEQALVFPTNVNCWMGERLISEWLILTWESKRGKFWIRDCGIDMHEKLSTFYPDGHLFVK